MIPIVIFPSIIEDDELANQLTYPIYSVNAITILSGTNSVAPTIIRNRKLEDTDVTRILTVAGGGTVSTDVSLDDLTDLADYTVTSGKTAKVILVLRSATNDTTFNIREGASSGDITGTIKYAYSGAGFDTTALLTVCPDWDVTELTFAATKHIVIDIVVGSLYVVSAMVIES